MRRNTLMVLMLAMACQPATPTATAGQGSDRFDVHVAALEKTVPGGFHIVVQKPFVVVGDESEATVKRRAARTVGWAAVKLQEAFFDEAPNEIIDIWLFKDKASYRKHAKSIFNDDPDTPYGYYSEEHDALIMNIATGGGTLVHEIVHPFVHADFPACPSWLNEGLGSLYEQCAEDDEGRIVGLTNWRLEGLQEAIRRGQVPDFEWLTSTSERQFYNEDPGTNYAQARYLCYYLQQQGLLRKFYREFKKNQKADPSGYETLKKVFGEKDMDAFKERWERYVLKLSFRS